MASAAGASRDSTSLPPVSASAASSRVATVLW